MHPTTALILAFTIMASSVHAQEPIESKIIGSDTQIRVVDETIGQHDVSALIGNSEDVVGDIRVMTAVDRVTLVMLGERRNVMTDALDTQLRSGKAIVNDLRNAIKINAIIVEILRKHGTEVPAVMAATITENDGLVLYVLARSDNG